MSYLLVSDSDGQILAEFDFLEDALESIDRLRQQGESDVFIARFDDRPGEIVGTKSLVTIRVPDS